MQPYLFRSEKSVPPMARPPSSTDSKTTDTASRGISRLCFRITSVISEATWARSSFCQANDVTRMNGVARLLFHVGAQHRRARGLRRVEARARWRDVSFAALTWDVGAPIEPGAAVIDSGQVKAPLVEAGVDGADVLWAFE